MTNHQVIIYAVGLLLVSSFFLFTSQNFFVPFGTLYEADVFYSSGNIYMPQQEVILCLVAIISLTILASRAAPGFDIAPTVTRYSARSYVLTLLAFIFIGSQLISWLVFEHYPRDVDHIARIFQAKMFAGGQLTVDTPPMAGIFFRLRGDHP